MSFFYEEKSMKLKVPKSKNERQNENCKQRHKQKLQKTK